MRVHLVKGFRKYLIFYFPRDFASRSCVCCMVRAIFGRFSHSDFGAMR